MANLQLRVIRFAEDRNSTDVAGRVDWMIFPYFRDTVLQWT